MDAPAGQHAVSLGVRRGRRGSVGAFSISHLLLDLRGWFGPGPHGLQPWLQGSYDRRERSDFRGYGSLHRVVSASARDDPDSCAAVVFYGANSRLSDAGLLVLLAVLQRRRIAGDDRSRGSRLVGSCGGI